MKGGLKEPQNYHPFEMTEMDNLREEYGRLSAKHALLEFDRGMQELSYVRKIEDARRQLKEADPSKKVPQVKDPNGVHVLVKVSGAKDSGSWIAVAAVTEALRACGVRNLVAHDDDATGETVLRTAHPGQEVQR